MSSQNDVGFKSFLASGAISAYKVVTIQSDGTITPAADNNRGIGVLQEDAADANYASVKLWSAPGSFMVAVSGGATTAGTTYSIITGGFAGTNTGTAFLRATGNTVASNGIVNEFVLV